MGMRTFLLSLGMAMSFIAVLPSCSKESEPVVKQDLAVENSSQKSEEHQLQELYDKQRILLLQGIRRQRKESQEFRSFNKEKPDDYVFDPEARENKIKAQPWAEQTKRFFLNLPLYFAEEIPFPSVHEISQYNIPSGEKKLLASALALANVASTLTPSTFRATGDNRKRDQQASTRAQRVKEAKAHCEAVYQEALSHAVTTAAGNAVGAGTVAAVVGGVAGSTGGPAGAYIGAGIAFANTLAATFVGVYISEVVTAWLEKEACMSAAENTKCKTIAPNVVIQTSTSSESNSDSGPIVRPSATTSIEYPPTA